MFLYQETIDFIIDLIFLCDIGINLLTGYIHP